MCILAVAEESLTAAFQAHFPDSLPAKSAGPGLPSAIIVLADTLAELVSLRETLCHASVRTVIVTGPLDNELAAAAFAAGADAQLIYPFEDGEPDRTVREQWEILQSPLER